MGYDYLHNRQDIYRESFAIIRAESDLTRFPAALEPVVVRMIHAAADPAIAADIVWTPQVVANAQAALKAGAPILCDAQMVANGIIKGQLARQNEVICQLGSPGLAELATTLGTTKTAAAVELWRPQLDGALVAIGNAPTALFRLLEIISETGLKPAAIIGIPVGFVGAAESKQALIENTLGLEYLTQKGRRGGSAVTAAAVNAIVAAR